jgi:hypothetical protein
MKNILYILLLFAVNVQGQTYSLLRTNTTIKWIKGPEMVGNMDDTTKAVNHWKWRDKADPLLINTTERLGMGDPNPTARLHILSSPPADTPAVKTIITIRINEDGTIRDTQMVSIAIPVTPPTKDTAVITGKVKMADVTGLSTALNKKSDRYGKALEVAGNYALSMKDTAYEQLTMINTIAANITIPAGLKLPIGWKINIRQKGIGTTTIIGLAGVSIEANENKFRLFGKNSPASIRKESDNEYWVVGDLK